MLLFGKFFPKIFEHRTPYVQKFVRKNFLKNNR